MMRSDIRHLDLSNIIQPGDFWARPLLVRELTAHARLKREPIRRVKHKVTNRGRPPEVSVLR